jgi:DNA-binding response OmpR family regulator
VDDVDGVRNAVRAVLEDRGYRVLVASTGEEALEIIHSYEGKIHLAIVDVVMPRIPGTEIARRIQFTRPTKVILTSGHTDRVLERSGVHVEDHALLRKAFSPAELLRKVREVLDLTPGLERSCG